MWVQLNDRLVDESEARVSVFDRGFIYGDGVFETFRTYQRTGFGLDAHLKRMSGAVASLKFRLPRPPSTIKQDVGTVLERNGLGEAVVRVSVSRGRGGRGPGLAGVGDPTYVVAAWPLPEDLDDRLTRGATLCTVSIRKQHPSALPPHAKLANYLNSVLAVAEAAERGCDDGLMLTTDGMLAECGVANFFFVRDQVVLTAALESGVLPGVTRATVLQLGRGVGMEVWETRCTPDLLDDATEVFVTNSVVGVQPVSMLDTRQFPVPGPVTHSLMQAYQDRVLKETGGRHYRWK